MAVLDIKLESLICPEAPLPDSYRATGERSKGSGMPAEDSGGGARVISSAVPAGTGVFASAWITPGRFRFWVSLSLNLD